MNVVQRLYKVVTAVVVSGTIGFVACREPRLEKRDIWIDVTVPDAGWEVNIEKVYRTGSGLCVVSRLTSGDQPSAMVISTASDTVKVQAPPLPVKHFVLGKTWSWENDEPYVFLESEQELPAELQSADRLYVE